MLMKPLLFSFFFLLQLAGSANEPGFVFNGFTNSNLSLDGTTRITPTGLLELTDFTTYSMMGHAFHPSPLHFKSPSGKILSFSTTYAFAIRAHFSSIGGLGIAFFISHTNNLSTALGHQYFGLVNSSDNGNSNNHIFAVEFDTILNPDVHDINDNHVGIDINGVISNKSLSAGYYDESTGSFKNLTLNSGQPMQAWVDYNGEEMLINITLSPLGVPKPSRPLLSSTIDLSTLMLDSMYVGFSSSSGPLNTSHFILGWSFKLNGTADALDYSRLPALPRIKTKNSSNVLAVPLSVATSLVLLITVAVIMIMVRRRKKYAELLEDWEVEYGPHRFSYKDLFQATKGFRDKELLGTGGFGSVYRGVMHTSKLEVAVKKVSHESRQGMKEFVAEIVSIGQLRHRNLVQLLGYCRRKGELLLVYEFMPNGSLDRLLHKAVEPTLTWAQRFRIIKGVASAVLYLHEDWEQVVIHRDIKASNVLLDREMNGRLGDFGLARLYDHGTDPQTTHIVGTMGYLAPELARMGKASPETDVFAYGVFLLEVASGRRPIDPEAQEDELILMDWVLKCWQKGNVLETRDAKLEDEYSAFEVELVLKLGLLCSNPRPELRPGMRQVVQFLEGDLALPELPESYMSYSSLSMIQNGEFDSYTKSLSPSFTSLSGISQGR